MSKTEKRNDQKEIQPFGIILLKQNDLPFSIFCLKVSCIFSLFNNEIPLM